MSTKLSLSELQNRFSIPRVVEFDELHQGLPRVVVSSALAEAHIYLHGAHVTHFQPRGQAPMLFISERSDFSANKPIRGGVPVIFPWFSQRKDHPISPMHGFVRLMDWSMESVKQTADGVVAIVLTLKSNETTRAAWPHDFELRYTISIGSRLDMSLEVRNTSANSFEFEEALHTYLAVGDVRQIAIHGLAGSQYLDKVDGMKRKTQGSDPIRIDAEHDRVYLNTKSTCTADDPSLNRRLIVAKENSDSTVVWNPWIAKSKAMPDFKEQEYPFMICIETCNVKENAVMLEAKRSHVMRAIISAESL